MTEAAEPIGELNPGDYRITPTLMVACYCGFACSQHSDLQRAETCIRAHQVHCEWSDHDKALQYLAKFFKEPF